MKKKKEWEGVPKVTLTLVLPLKGSTELFISVFLPIVGSSGRLQRASEQSGFKSEAEYALVISCLLG